MCFFIYNFIYISKYAWVILLKGKKFITITNAFQKVLDKSNRKSNKIWLIKSVGLTINKLNHGYKK